MMKAIFTHISLLFLFSVNVFGYSSIWNLDEYDSKRLKEQAGITIKPVKEFKDGFLAKFSAGKEESTPMQYVEVSYDCSKLKKDQDVILTLHLIGDDGKTIFAYHAERNEGDNNLKIAFTVTEKAKKYSHLQIYIPQPPTKEVRAFGDSGFGGYSLSLSRIMELAGKVEAGNPVEKK